MTKPPRRKSRHFSVVVRRAYEIPRETLFAAWTNPDVRSCVLAPEIDGNQLKKLDISEGGVEVIESRWRNRPAGETTRRYAALRPPEMIIAQVVTTIETEARAPGVVIAAQELLLFKPTPEGTEIVASTQVTAMQPNLIHAVEDDWNAKFDRFEDQLDPQRKADAP